MKKTGELTTQQLVTIIILIISFVVILFLIFRLNLPETSNKEICHNSVVLKAKSSLGGNLDCKTTYVCISGGDKCEDFTDSKTIKIDLKKDDAKNQIMKAIADEMADCWWMFGEGKIDYVGLDVQGATIGKVNCALCSIISFDKKIQDNEKLKQGISQEDFYEYLRLTEKETGESYLYYLYNVNNVDDVKKIMNLDSQETIDPTKQYDVLTGVGKLGALKTAGNWLFSGFDVANGFFLITPKFPDYGNMPVIIREKSRINELKCDNFLTKA